MRSKDWTGYNFQKKIPWGLKSDFFDITQIVCINHIWRIHAVFSSDSLRSDLCLHFTWITLFFLYLFPSCIRYFFFIFNEIGIKVSNTFVRYLLFSSILIFRKSTFRRKIFLLFINILCLIFLFIPVLVKRRLYG